jgi:hypothetical protein
VPASSDECFTKYYVFWGILLDALTKGHLTFRGYQQQVVQELKEVLSAAKDSL